MADRIAQSDSETKQSLEVSQVMVDRDVFDSFSTLSNEIQQVFFSDSGEFPVPKKSSIIGQLHPSHSGLSATYYMKLGKRDSV